MPKFPWILLLLPACASLPDHLSPADANARREFTYDFAVPGKSQSNLWRDARNFFAEAFGDSRAVLRVLDERDGTLLGRGVATWQLGGNVCLTDYQIRFAAKDGKARLQFELLEGAPPLSPCPGWPTPSRAGHLKITAEFDRAAQNMGLALSGKDANTKLKDF